MTPFEEVVEFDILYGNLKKCFNPLRVSLYDWQKMKPFVIKNIKTLSSTGIKSLLRRKAGVSHAEESDKELEV